jgi:UDP-N-acetylmuramate dehydrogenase
MTVATAPQVARLQAELTAIGVAVQANELLSRHTIFRIGGPADLYAPVYTRDELLQALSIARRHGAPVTILGGGSNVLVSDRGIRGLVLSNRTRDWEERDQGDWMLLKVASGVALPGLALRTARQGWAGLHWAEGIPGTVGGGVIFNAGAFGGTLAESVLSVTATSPEGEQRDFSLDELSYGYRSSAFQRELSGWVVLGAELRLRRGDARELQAELAAIRKRRQATQPKEPSAGSIFRNSDPGNPALASGRLIEEAGLKGTRRGDAIISPHHGNFFVNLGAAKASDVAALIELAQEKVWERAGVRLQTEVRFIGDWEGH